jgi:hypothetical protein
VCKIYRVKCDPIKPAPPVMSRRGKFSLHSEALRNNALYLVDTYLFQKWRWRAVLCTLHPCYQYRSVKTLFARCHPSYFLAEAALPPDVIYCLVVLEKGIEE